jgi:hypothetical protein
MPRAQATDGLGLASFTNFGFLRGPPGLWTLSFKSGLASTTAQVSIVSIVFDMVLSSSTGTVNPPPDSFKPGVPLSTQPVVQLFSKYRTPVAGRRVLAFASQSPYLRAVVDPSVDVEGHDLQGQRFATLANFESLPSDENGLARFDNLTILGSTRYVCCSLLL